MNNFQKPKKKELFPLRRERTNFYEIQSNGRDSGYNQALSDYKAFLPDEKELKQLLMDFPVSKTKETTITLWLQLFRLIYHEEDVDIGEHKFFEDLAKTLAERIGKT